MELMWPFPRHRVATERSEPPWLVPVGGGNRRARYFLHRGELVLYVGFGLFNFVDAYWHIQDGDGADAVSFIIWGIVWAVYPAVRVGWVKVGYLRGRYATLVEIQKQMDEGVTVTVYGEHPTIDGATTIHGVAVVKGSVPNDSSSNEGR